MEYHESQLSINQELYDKYKEIQMTDYIQDEMDKYSDEEFYRFNDFADYKIRRIQAIIISK